MKFGAFAIAIFALFLPAFETPLHGTEIVLLDDSFIGSSLDTGTWSAPTPFGDVEGFVVSNLATTTTTVSGGSLNFGVTGSPFGGDDGVGIFSDLLIPFPTAGTSLTITGELATGTTGPAGTDRQWWTGVGFYRDNDNFFYLTARKEFGEAAITYVSDSFEFGARTIDDHITTTSIPETFSITIESTGLLTLAADGLSTTLTVDPDNFPSLRVFTAAVARNSGDTMIGKWDRIRLVRTVPEPHGALILAVFLGTTANRRRNSR